VKVTGQETLPVRKGRRIVLGCLGESLDQHRQAAREMETEFPTSTSVKKRYYVHSIHVPSCRLDSMAVKHAIQRGQRRTVVGNIFEKHIFDGASEHLGQHLT
jgi:hypothetical protein